MLSNPSPLAASTTPLPRISTADESGCCSLASRHYVMAIQQTLGMVLPSEILNAEAPEVQLDALEEALPLVWHSDLESPSGDIRFCLVCRARSNAFKFFFEMICRWLVPGKRLDATMFHAADFFFTDLGPNRYTLCDINIRIDNHDDLALIRQNLPRMEAELQLGAHSVYHARRILEIKGLTADEKTTLVQEHITHLVKRLPAYFGADILSEMQHILVVCRDQFKAQREYRHLARLIAYHYLFRQNLLEKVADQPARRHLSLKLTRSRLRDGSEARPVVGVLVGINFLHDNEVFEERHLLKAIQNYVSNVRLVDGSVFCVANRRDSLCLLYLEIEKNDGSGLSARELERLRKELPTDLKDRIGHLMHPVFMPPNEEEVLRNMLTLGNQLRYVRDLPQVMITFDQQTNLDVSFLVVLARVLRPESQSIQQLFQEGHSILQFQADRAKVLGLIRRRYQKEANVFRVRLPKQDYLRSDLSLDLQKARQVVVEELTRVIGEFRDFNGGMISKQNELFCAVRTRLGDKLRGNDFLLENFFYSLSPPIMRSVMEPHALQELFSLLLESVDQGFFSETRGSVYVRSDAQFVYAVASSSGKFFKEDLLRAVGALGLTSMELASTYVTVYDVPYVGYILRSEDLEQRAQFEETLRAVIGV